MATIVMIGAGKVSYHLAHRLQACGHQIAQIYSRNKAHAVRVAAFVAAPKLPSITDDLVALKTDADLYIIAVSDDALPEIAWQLSAILPLTATVAHTSGTGKSITLADYFDNSGVFYPLQSFSYDFLPEFETLPICIDATNAQVQAVLETVANSISNAVYFINDEQRGQLHLAAVFANNFVNRMYAVSEKLLAKQGLDLAIMLPLITETARKIQHISPQAAQTGPAVRNDATTLARHRAYLTVHAPELLPLYDAATQEIWNNTNRK